MKNKIEIYTGENCNFCTMAKDLLSNKSLIFIESKISNAPEKKQEMLSRTGGKFTVPQIFINGNLIGGYLELKSLEISGKLDKILL